MAAIRPTPAKYSSTWYGSASHFGRSSHQTKSIRSTTTLVWAYGIWIVYYIRPCKSNVLIVLLHPNCCTPRFFWCAHSYDTLHHQVKLSRGHCWIGTAADAYCIVKTIYTCTQTENVSFVVCMSCLDVYICCTTFRKEVCCSLVEKCYHPSWLISIK